jgi:hypothetical protein
MGKGTIAQSFRLFLSKSGISTRIAAVFAALLLGPAALQAESEYPPAMADSFGSLTRLLAETVGVKIQLTRSLPQWRVLRRPSQVLIQPKASSMGLWMRWLTA